MADPSVTTEVLPGTAALLGDPNQEQFTNTVLMPAYKSAYRELYDVFQRYRLATGRRTAYVYLPALTQILKPSQAGITDFGEPLEDGVWERGVGLTLTVTGVSDATPMEVTTSTTHGLSSGVEVELSGISGPLGVNDQWFITGTAANKFTLNGSYAGGAYVSGGTVIYSSEKFVEMNPMRELPQLDPASTLRWWKWENGRLYFIGSTSPRELKIEYASDGTPPSSGTVGIDGSQNFLMFRTASFIAADYDMPASADRWKREALGPSGEPDATGGALRGLVNPLIQAKNLISRRAGPFRERRTVYTRTIW